MRAEITETSKPEVRVATEPGVKPAGGYAPEPVMSAKISIAMMGQDG